MSIKKVDVANMVFSLGAVDPISEYGSKLNEVIDVVNDLASEDSKMKKNADHNSVSVWGVLDAVKEDLKDINEKMSRQHFSLNNNTVALKNIEYKVTENNREQTDFNRCIDFRISEFEELLAEHIEPISPEELKEEISKNKIPRFPQGCIECTIKDTCVSCYGGDFCRKNAEGI